MNSEERDFSRSTDQLVYLTGEIIDFVMLMEIMPATDKELRSAAYDFLDSLRDELVSLGYQLKDEGHLGELQWQQTILHQVDDLQEKSAEHSDPLHTLDLGLIEVQTQLMLTLDRLQFGSPLTPSGPRAV